MPPIDIIKAPEGRTLEFKRELPQKMGGILRTVIAFSNGSGGQIIIGVEDDKTIVGVDQDPLEIEERLSSAIYDSISPIPSVFFQTIAIQDKILFKIKVLSGPSKPYYLRVKGPEKGSYVRVGSTNRIVDQWGLTELRRQAMNRGIDEEIETRFGCDIFSMPVLGRYLSWRGLKIEPDVSYLEKEKLAVRFNGDCHPSIGGILLFCDFLPEPYEYAGFTMALYGGGDRSKLTHSHSVKTGLLDMPEAVLDGVGSYLGNDVEIAGLRRKEDMEIPVLALREAIVNAICHRDYSMKGAVNKIEIFSDRIEIVSPGTLPTGIALDDLGQGISEVRNAQIVKIFRKAGYIEQLGTGIIRMRQACGKAGLSEPLFQEVGNFFKVTFPRRKIILPPDLSKVVDLLNDQGGLGSSQIAMQLGIHQNTALNRLKKLQDMGIVNKLGRGAGVRYEVKL